MQQKGERRMSEENRVTTVKELEGNKKYIRIEVHTIDISREENHLIEDKLEQFCDEVKKITVL